MTIGAATASLSVASRFSRLARTHLAALMPAIGRWII
jgi:hypothetical protein